MVEMYIDCENIASAQLEPRGQIDVNGDALIGKQPDGDTVGVNTNTHGKLCSVLKKLQDYILASSDVIGQCA